MRRAPGRRGRDQRARLALRAGRPDRRARLTLRAARPDEQEPLTELAVRSKGHWGHDTAFLERARPELTLRPEDLAAVVVAERGGEIAGFSHLDLGAGELTMLFVDPPAIGSGVGAALLARACADAAAAGSAELLVESDPDAEGFYLRHGAQRVGTRRSPSTGRELPLLRLPTGAGPRS